MRNILLLLVLFVSLLSGQTKPRPGAQVDWGNPINRGLISWWLFNEGAGSRLTDIAGRNDGVLTNMDPTDWVGNLHGGALDFDGSNDSVSVPLDPSLNKPKGEATYSVWFKADAANVVARLMTLKAPFSLLQNSSPSRIGIQLNTTSGSSALYVTFSDTSSWHLLTCTYDGATIRVFLDGFQKGSVAKTGTINDESTEDLYFGRFSAAIGQLFNGQIGGAQIYDRALTTQEVRQLFHFPYGGILHTAERLTRWFVAPAASKIFVIITN